MDPYSSEIMETLKAFNLPYKFSNKTLADGNCFSLAVVDQIQLPEHWGCVLPRAQIRDYRVFKKEIVRFIRTDVQLQQNLEFQLAKESLTHEDLRQIQSNIYGHLDPDQAYEKFLDRYSETDGVYAENVIVVCALSLASTFS